MYKKITLKKNWSFIGIPPQTKCTPLEIAESDMEDWLGIDVPGDINRALLKHRTVPDPHYGDQAQQSYWISSRDWWYKNTFELGEQSFEDAVLCLENVDGHADVWLNGKLLGTMKNAFRAFRFDISGVLKEKDNQILIRFHSIDKFLESSRTDKLNEWDWKRCFIRKPQFNFGWDWAIPLPSLGLAGKVWIELNNQKLFQDFSVKTFCDGRVDFAFEVSDAARSGEYVIEIEVNGHGTALKHRINGSKKKIYTGHSNSSENSFAARLKSYCSLFIPEPKLWYPNGYGEPNLYDYSVYLKTDGTVVDVRKGRIGLRESKIREMPFCNRSQNGRSFEMEINGRSIFCKGANWVPLELAPWSATDEQYEFYLKKAKEANFNMLRVWGGGIYEKEKFYDLCDEYGIMVWQDFMFASGGYPVDLLCEEIILEAEYQLKRLRNHSSIVIWCGCNEDVFSWQHPAEKTMDERLGDGVYSGKNANSADLQKRRLHDDPLIYSMILRGLVNLHGLGLPYVESSPQSHDDYGNIPDSGNSHISCWKYALLQAPEHPEKFKDHFEQACSFNSEFCIQGPCSERSFKKFMARTDYWPPNEHWTYHIQTGHNDLPHHQQTILMGEGIIGPIDSLSKYIKYGQTVHLEMMRSEFESARRDRPACGGTMVWMYNDCWPTSNWSIIDYYRELKPAYYAAKRACCPLLPIIFPRAEKTEFFFANDTARERNIEMLYGEESLSGEKLWVKARTVIVNANCTVKFDFINNSQLKRRDSFLFIDAKVAGKKMDKVTFFPHGWRDMKWPEASPAIEILTQTQHSDSVETQIKIKTDNYARLFHLLPESSGIWIEFSDNYFDLSTGDEKLVTVYSKRRIKQNDLKLLSWNTDWE